MPTRINGMGELIDIGDTQLFVERRGQGPALIVLHGGPGADHTQLLNPLLPLSDEYTLYFVDQRSQGRSETTPRETWTVHQAAADVSALARALGLDAYAVIGHSYGALVVLQHAVSFPGEGAASIVSHGVPSLRWYRLKEELEILEPTEVREQVRAAWNELNDVTEPKRASELIAAQWPFHFKDPFNPAIEELNRITLDLMIHTPEVNQHMSATGYGGFDVEESLGELKQPVLILTGRGERVCPLPAAKFMAARIPDCELVIFEDSGHVSYVEEHDLYVQTVRRFLHRHIA